MPLTDLVVASEEHVAALAESDWPHAGFAAIDIKGIDTVKFGTLHALLMGEAFESILPEYKPIAEASDDGPWVSRVPDRLVRHLAGLSPDERASVAQRWAATEEFALDGRTPLQVSAVFEQICALSRRVGGGDGLYLWMSL